MHQIIMNLLDFINERGQGLEFLVRYTPAHQAPKDSSLIPRWLITGTIDGKTSKIGVFSCKSHKIYERQDNYHGDQVRVIEGGVKDYQWLDKATQGLLERYFEMLEIEVCEEDIALYKWENRVNSSLIVLIAPSIPEEYLI